jgi:uncharacterized protein
MNTPIANKVSNGSCKLTIIINVTSACNLNCLYCFRGYKKPEFMDLDTLSNIFNKISTLPTKELNIIWHGGEPLLVGLDFYKEVVRLEKDILVDVKIRNKIQTNGTLLNEEFVKFFKDNSFGVGVSLDGPQNIHDANRIKLNGSGSFNEVMRGLEILKKYKITFGVIAVLTKKFLGEEKMICNFANSIGANGVKFSFYIPTKSQDKTLMISNKDYEDSMIRLFKIWLEKKDKFSIKPIEYIVESMFFGHSFSCDFSNKCFLDFYSFLPNGDVFSCNRFSENENKLGNINEGSMEDIIKKGHEFNEERKIKIINDCGECKWKKICEGGCSYESFIHFRDRNKKTPYCSARKAIFEFIYNNVKTTLPKKIPASKEYPMIKKEVI